MAGGEDDTRGGGDGAKGFKMINWHGIGTDFPALQDIQKHVVDKGLSKAPKDKVGELLYNRGVYNSMLIAEGIAQAQKLAGKKAVDGERRAPGPGEHQSRRRAPEGARARGLHRSAEADLRQP